MSSSVQKYFAVKSGSCSKLGPNWRDPKFLIQFLKLHSLPNTWYKVWWKSPEGPPRLSVEKKKKKERNESSKSVGEGIIITTKTKVIRRQAASPRHRCWHLANTSKDVYCSRRLTDRGDWEFRPSNFPFPLGNGSLSNTLILWATRVSLSNGLLFRPAASARCTSVTDIQGDRQTTRGYISRNRRNRWCDAEE